MKRILLSIALGAMIVTVQAAPSNPLLGGQRNHQAPVAGQPQGGQQVAPPGGEPPATVPAGGPSSEDLALLKKSKKGGSAADEDGYPEALKTVLNSLRVSAMVDDTVALRYVTVQSSSSASGSPAPTPVGSTGTAAAATKQKEQSLIVRGGQTISMGGVLLKVMVSNDGIVITDNNNKIAFAGQVDTTDMAPQDIIKGDLIVEDAKIKDILKTGASTTTTSATAEAK